MSSAMPRTASSTVSDSAISRGVSSSSDASRASSAALIRPRWRLAAKASAVSAATWEVKALVEATPISGPAWVGSISSASRAMVDSCTFTSAAVVIPRALHQRSAARVSAVSPDWETASARAPGPSAGSR